MGSSSGYVGDWPKAIPAATSRLSTTANSNDPRIGCSPFTPAEVATTGGRYHLRQGRRAKCRTAGGIEPPLIANRAGGARAVARQGGQTGRAGPFLPTVP